MILDIKLVATFIGELLVIAGAITPIVANMRKISDGTRCQLRSDMLRIYYRNKEDRKIRQYEYENFVLLYDAYKALKGNSFIEKIHNEVVTWEIVT